MTQVKEITPQSTMAEVLEAYPGAQRLLFQRYHIGGCSSCGFSPSDTLEAVLRAKNVLDAGEVVAEIKTSYEADQKLQISPRELEGLLKEGRVKLLDVRQEGEHRMVHIDGDLLASDELVSEIIGQWPKDAMIVVYCHHGNTSMDAASYLISHGFSQVKSLRGGIDAWSREIDPLLPRY